MQNSNQAKAMLYYELTQLRQTPINLCIVLLLPSMALILIKLFFDSVLLFGYVDGYSEKMRGQYYNFSSLKEQNATFIHYYPPEYGYLINNSVNSMLNDYRQFQREGLINKKTKFDDNDIFSMIKPVKNLTELQISQLNRAIQQFTLNNQLKDNIQYVANQLNISEAEIQIVVDMYLGSYNISTDNINTQTFDSSLYTIIFNEKQNNTLTYTVHYNQTLLAALNLLRNGTTWNIFNYNQNYQNALGTQLQFYIDQAILREQNVNNTKINIYPYPSKQLTLNDSSQMDHGVICLGLIILFISATHYIARDRGKQQTSLRLLGLKEFPYIVFRFLFSTVFVTLSAVLMCICGQFSGIIPFKSTNIGVNIVVGLLIGSMISGQLIFISTIFAGRGVVGAIVFVLLMMLLTNFIIEMVIYIVYSGYSLSDTSLISKGVQMTLSILFPNINLVNFIDTIRYNAIQMGGNDKVGIDIFNTVKQTTCTKIVVTTQYIECTYNMMSVGAVYGILIGQNIVFLALAVIISFVKPEVGKPSVNPFKLISAALRIQRRQQLTHCKLENVKISYSSMCKKPLTVVHDFNLDIQNIKQQVQQAKIGLLGVSAAGKTSMLSALSGQIPVKKSPNSTAMVINHNIYNPEERYLIKEVVSVCPQANENVIQDLTLRQNIYLSGLLSVCQSSQQLNNHINNLLDSFQLIQHQNKKVKQLSGGMQRRLSICNCFISCFVGEQNDQVMRLLILDELSSGQDPFTCRLINTKLNEICDKNPNINFILSTHDMKQVSDVCNYMVMMEKGHIKISSTVQNVQMQDENVPFIKILFKQSNNIRNLTVDETIQFLKQTFDHQQYQIIAKTLQFIKIKLRDREILPQIYQFLQSRVDQIQIDKGNLSDIFMDNIQKDENIIENINDEISQPDVSKKKIKTIRGLYKLYYLQDYQNSYIKIPFVAIFIALIPIIMGISLLINNAIVDFIDGQIGNLTTAAYGATFQGCLSCCGIQINSEGDTNLAQTLNQMSNCMTNSQCFSSSFESYYTSGQCFDAMRLIGLPVVYSSIYRMNDIDSHSQYYTGYKNNIYKYDYVINDNAHPITFSNNIESDIATTQHKNNINISENQMLRLKCYQCATMCDLECSIYINYPKCIQQCLQYINFDQINNASLSHNSGDVSCENACILAEGYPQYQFYRHDSKDDFNFIKNNISKWQNNTQILSDMLISNGKYFQEQIHEFTNILIPQAMLEFNENETNIYGFFPQFRGGFLTYEEYKAKFKTYVQLNNDSISMPINYTNQQFDLRLDKFYNTTYKLLQSDMKVTQIEYDKFNEIYNSINLGLQPGLFDNINYLINKIHNELLKQSQSTRDISQIRQINTESKPYPLYAEQYKSNSFSTYIQILQTLIIQIFLNIPIIHSAIIFTTLNNQQFIDLLKVHGIFERSIYGHFLFYSMLYQVPAILLGSLVGYFVEVPQLMYSPIMFILYSCTICFANNVMGIIISRLCKDKKQAILICSILIIVVVFISLFSMKSSFLMLILPQLYAIHSLLYLNNLSFLEELNFLAPLLISLAYFFMIIIPQAPMFEVNSDMHLNNYMFEDVANHRKQINEQNLEQNDQNNINIVLQNDYDLIVDDISVCIQNAKILDDIKFKIQRNNSFGLLGLSGSGKSVTLQTLLRQIKQTYGNVFIRNSKTNTMSNISNYKHNIISYVSQIDILLDNLTMKQHIDIVCDIHCYKTRNYVDSLVSILQLTQHYKKKVSQLSGGTKRRLSFLLALLQCESNVIAFDETSTGLSPDLKIILWSIITMIQQKLQKSCIITTHYMDEIQAMVQEFIILQKGKIMVKTNTNNLMKQQEAYDIIYESQGRKRLTTNETIQLLSANQTSDRYYIDNEDIQDVFLSIYDNLQTSEYQCM